MSPPGILEALFGFCTDNPLHITIISIILKEPVLQQYTPPFATRKPALPLLIVIVIIIVIIIIVARSRSRATTTHTSTTSTTPTAGSSWISRSLA
jgi:hypothetical protein